MSIEDSPRASEATTASVRHEAVLDAARTARVLVGVGAVLLTMHLAAHLANGRVPGVSIVVGLFDVDDEQSLYTWYSATMLALTGTLAFGLATADRQHRVAWASMGLVGILASVDEVASMHERVAFALRAFFDVPLFFWVVPAAIATALAAPLAWKLIRGFHASLRRRLVVGGLVYVTGALVVEVFGGLIAESGSMESGAYWISTAVEEGFELGGVLIVAWALLVELSRRQATFGLRFRGD